MIMKSQTGVSTVQGPDRDGILFGSQQVIPFFFEKIYSVNTLNRRRKHAESLFFFIFTKTLQGDF